MEGTADETADANHFARAGKVAKDVPHGTRMGSTSTTKVAGVRRTSVYSTPSIVPATIRGIRSIPLPLARRSTATLIDGAGLWEPHAVVTRHHPARAGEAKAHCCAGWRPRPTVARGDRHDQRYDRILRTSVEFELRDTTTVAWESRNRLHRARGTQPPGSPGRFMHR